MKKFLLFLLCVTTLLTFVACSSTTSTTNQPEEKIQISDAINSVEGLRTLKDNYGNGIFKTFEDDYATMEFYEDRGIWTDSTIEKLDELNKNLGFSGALAEKFQTVRAIDGTLTEENDNYKVTWSFDGDKLTITYEMK